jgi:CheY-like chemotaxis protein
MTGGELIDELRADARTTKTPIVLLTGTRGASTAADATVSKPFDRGELIALANRLTGRGN